MSCIGAVVNKMMQINGEMIFENDFVVLLDVFLDENRNFRERLFSVKPHTFSKTQLESQRQSTFTIDVFIRELYKYWTLMLRSYTHL